MGGFGPLFFYILWHKNETARSKSLLEMMIMLNALVYPVINYSSLNQKEIESVIGANKTMKMRTAYLSHGKHGQGFLIALQKKSSAHLLNLLGITHDLELGKNNVYGCRTNNVSNTI